MEKNTLSRSIKRALYGGTAVVAVGLASVDLAPPVGATEYDNGYGGVACPTGVAGIKGVPVSAEVFFDGFNTDCLNLGYSIGCGVDGEDNDCIDDEPDPDFSFAIEFDDADNGNGTFRWTADAARPAEDVYTYYYDYRGENGYGGTSLACRYSYTGGATQDEGLHDELDHGYGGTLFLVNVLGCANESTPPDVPVCLPENRPTPAQCKSAGGGTYLIGYNTGDFGEPLLCPCPVDPNNEPISVRDCSVGQGQPNNCFPVVNGEPTIGRDEVSQSVSIVEGSMCAIHCFPIDGRRICKEICPP